MRIVTIRTWKFAALILALLQLRELETNDFRGVTAIEFLRVSLIIDINKNCTIVCRVRVLKVQLTTVSNICWRQLGSDFGSFDETFSNIPFLCGMI